MTTVLALTVAAVLAPLALSAPTASHATLGGPSVPPIRVQTVEPEHTVNRVFGTVDSLAYTAMQTVDEQSPTVHGSGPHVPDPDFLNLVYGVVQNASGTAQAGVTMVLELLPSDGYDDLPGGAQVIELTRGVTDELGRYGLTVPMSDEVLAEAEYLNGTVNMMLTAVQYQATGRGYGMYLAAGAIYSSMVDFGPGAGGVALAPVNVGAMTIEEVKAMTGASGLVEVTPGNDPEDPSTVAVDRPNVLMGPAGDAAASVPAVSEPYVETPLSVSTSFVALPPDFPEFPAEFAKDDDGTATGDARCKQIANQGRWFVDAHDVEYEWQPVGEVHSVPGTKTKYVYSERANTQLGAGVKVNAGPWKISGSTSVTNDSSATVTLPYQPDSFARRVEAEFVYHHNRKTWCPDGYDETDGPYALHMEEVVGKQWAGGVRYDSRDISSHDNGNEAQRAHEEGRTGTLGKGNQFDKTKGKTFKYTFGVSAFGVGLSSESVNDIKHTMRLVAGTSRESWTMFGDVSVPADPVANHTIYVYY